MGADLCRSFLLLRAACVYGCFVLGPLATLHSSLLFVWSRVQVVHLSAGIRAAGMSETTGQALQPGFKWLGSNLGLKLV